MNSIRRFSVVVSALVVCASLARAQGGVPDLSARTAEIPNWAAPPYWKPPAQPISVQEREGGVRTEGVVASSTLPLPFIGVDPCRLVDTREAGFPAGYGPPSLVGGLPRDFDLNDDPLCPGIPVSVGAYSLNITVTNTQGPGHIVIYAEGGVFPPVATLNYIAGQTIANAAVVPAGTGGGVTVVAAVSGTDLIIDINGYYGPQSVVTSLNEASGDVTLAAGANISITASGPPATLTIGTDATSSNTANTIVRRDGSGGFSAGTVALSGNLTLPTSSSFGGVLFQSGSSLLHTFGLGGGGNLFLGLNAGNLTTASNGSLNTGIGNGALQNIAFAFGNTAIGAGALNGVTQGLSNTAIGAGALPNAGSSNIAVGESAGVNITGSGNIDIGSFGVAGESGTIRIGTGSTHTRAFLAGVRGVTTGAADGLTVLIDSNGQLGTISSSASVKREISDVGEASSPLLKLRPVSFFYRNDIEGIRQYGLIAEEVARVMPELVQISRAGKAETVRYHFLSTLLLNELQKQHRAAEAQERTIEQQKETIDHQQAEIEALKARLSRLEARLDSRP